MCSLGHFFDELKYIDEKHNFRETLRRFLSQYEKIDNVILPFNIEKKQEA